MAILKQGSTGEEVREIQERLQIEGFYTGPIDGDFGPGTDEAVKAFQRAAGLAVDGQVGDNTWARLFDDSQAPVNVNQDTDNGVTINRSLRLPDHEYFRDSNPNKNLITIHHTVGGSAKNTYIWWMRDGTRVGTAYVIDRDGSIYEFHSPEYWAGHHGVPGDGNQLDFRGIGIELCNFGPVFVKDGGQYNAYNRPFQGQVYDNGVVWRHSQHYEQYPDVQVRALGQLINYLIDKFPGIERQCPKDKQTTDYQKYKDYRGVVGHCHFLTSKSDPHPGLNWGHLIGECRLQETD